MEDGFGLDVGKESVLIEQHRTPSIVSHVEPIREELVINVFDRFLQGGDVPLHCNLLFDGPFFSSPRVPGSRLSLFCLIDRLGMSLLKWYSWQDVECFLAGASRNAALTLFTPTV